MQKRFAITISTLVLLKKFDILNGIIVYNDHKKYANFLNLNLDSN
jgi:hypothetical protein